MKVLVLGQSGQLAMALAQAAVGQDHNLVCLGRHQCDLRDLKALQAHIIARAPDVIINAAAYTQVDTAQSEVDAARLLNVEAPRVAARAARQVGSGFIHISTDYVFDGQKAEPYFESDATAPLNVYGQTKRDGEVAVLEAHDGAMIVRSTWIHSPFGKNFVKTMLTRARTQTQFQIVHDQIGAPTSAQHLAEALLSIARAKALGHVGHGVYHLTSSGVTSWQGFAEAIFAATRDWRLGEAPVVTGIATTDYPTPAPRPLNSRLNCDKIADEFGIVLPDWQTGLEASLAGLAGEFDDRSA